MKQWGIFVTKKQLNRVLRRIRRAKLDVFEVRELTFGERMMYLRDDLSLYLGEPHIIMFNATEGEYDKFICKYSLQKVF